MLIAFSISPSGGDETGGISAAVAEAVKVVRNSGLPCETNAMFTNVEGAVARRNSPELLDRLPQATGRG